MYKKEVILEEENFRNCSFIQAKVHMAASGSHSPSSSIALHVGAGMLHPHVTAVLILWFLMQGRSHFIM
jgi:hypothetical protein